MPKQKKDTDERPQDEGPFNLPNVDEPSSAEADTPTGKQGDTSTGKKDDTSQTDTSQQDDMSTEEPDEVSKLKQHLELVVEEAVALRNEKPSLSTKPNAYISEEVDQALRRTVNVLEARYGKGFSKSIVLDYARRMVLHDAFERAEESQLVRWLDQVLEEE